MLETRDLTIRFGGHVAVNAVSCAFAPGTLTAIVGPNGAGKTTYFNLVSGQLSASSGSVWLGGRELTRLGAAERTRAGLGRAFQLTQLFPHLTVLENVLLPGLSAAGAFLRGPTLRARAAELLGRVGLTERAAHRPNELSGGEQQRAALARALMNGPELLLADEPTGNLDSKTGEDVLRYLFELAAERNLTLVIVTHNETVAARCRRHVVLRDGLPVA